VARCVDVCVGIDLDTLFAGNLGHRLDDLVHPTLWVVDPKLEIHVAHQFVQRRRVVRRSAEKDERVLEQLPEFRMGDVLADVIVHRAE